MTKTACNPKPYPLPDALLSLLESDERHAREGAYRILGAWLHRDGTNQSDGERRTAARRLLEKGQQDEENRYVHEAIGEVLTFEATKAQVHILTAERDEARAQAKQLKARTNNAEEARDAARTGVKQLEAQVNSVLETRDAAQGEVKQLKAQMSSTLEATDAAHAEAAAALAKVSKVSGERDTPMAEAVELRQALDETRTKRPIRSIQVTKETFEAQRARLAKEAIKQTDGRIGEQPYLFQCRLEDGSWGPEMVVIPKGTFLMGSPADEAERRDDEEQHQVVITKDFALSRYAITFALFDRMPYEHKPDDRGWGREQQPVVDVSWADATAYADWLSGQTDCIYKLPSEAQWEFAARAGTLGPFSFDGKISAQKVNYDATYTYDGSAKGTYRERPVAVGSLPANLWGLYEVHGNVWEWVQDAYEASYAGAPTDGAARESGGTPRCVLRGGSWADEPGGCVPPRVTGTRPTGVSMMLVFG